MSNLTLTPINKNTGIGSEFVGIYNTNNGSIVSKVTEIENRIEEINVKNNTTLINLTNSISAESIESMKASFNALTQKYNDLSNTFQDYKTKYEALLTAYNNTLKELKKINDSLEQLK